MFAAALCPSPSTWLVAECQIHRFEASGKLRSSFRSPRFNLTMKRQKDETIPWKIVAWGSINLFEFWLWRGFIHLYTKIWLKASDIMLYFPYKLSQTHHSWTSVNIIQRSQSCGSTPRLPRMSMSSTGPVAYPRGWPPGAPSQRQKAPWGSTWQKFGNPRPFRSGIQWWVTSWTCSCPPHLKFFSLRWLFRSFFSNWVFRSQKQRKKGRKLNVHRIILIIPLPRTHLRWYLNV